jgi:hypothetical protein
MQHAQIGYREFAKSCRANSANWKTCVSQGVTVRHNGRCLDWSIAVPRAHEAKAMQRPRLPAPLA